MTDPRPPRPGPADSTRRGRARETGAPGEDPGGFAAEIIPLLRDGLLVVRTLLDVAIQRLDQIEEGRVAHVRRETYETILDVLDEEIGRLEDEEPGEAVDAQLAALRSIRVVIERQLRRTEPGRKDAEGETDGNGHTARTRKRSVTID